jgi:general secretion pathway protein D
MCVRQQVDGASPKRIHKGDRVHSNKKKNERVRGGGRWVARAFSVLALMVSACSAIPKAPYIEPPDMMDQLANVDLAPTGPIGSIASGDNASTRRGSTRSEMYPGDDRVAGRKKNFSGVSSGSSGYELNFSDAELSELAKVIFRDTLNVPYVFDSRVQGRVTVSTGGPVSRNELLAVLEAVLEMNKASLISDGTLYRIVPEAERVTRSVSIFDYAKERGEIGPGYGVAILALKYVSSETMMRMLESLAANKDTLRASVYNNLLIIRGSASERETLVDLALTFDVDWMVGQSSAIFTLANASPEEVVKELQQVFQAEQQGKGLVRFQVIRRLNAILVLTPKSEVLTEVEAWVMRLDRGGAEAEGYYVYRVENGRAKDLAELLTASFGGGTGAVGRAAEEREVAPTDSASTLSSFSGIGSSGSGSAEASSGAASGGGGGGVSSFAAGRLGAADAARDAGTSETSPTPASPGDEQSGIRITADERNNTLLIKASGRKYREILGVLRKIDRPPLQVLINATIAEVTLSDSLSYGVQFFLQKNKGLDGALGFANGDSINISPTVPGLNFIVGAVATNPKIILDALAQETAVRVVSSPSIVVLHNQPATLQVGDEVPVSTRSATSLTTDTPVIVNEIQFKNTGVILKVTPRINSNGLVTMEIEQEISAVARNVGGDSLTPAISQRRITSTIAVQSGQMVVLGGLISEQMDQSKNRVPVIGKIPYLGDVLGAKTDTGAARTELVIFLRPSVIRDAVDASNVAEAVRASMQSLAPRPAAWDMNIESAK